MPALSPKTVRNIKRYSLALGLLAAITILCYYLNALLGISLPLMLFLLATTLTAWYGGLGPGLVTVIGGALITSVYFRPLAATLTGPALIEDSKVLISMSLGFIISWAFSSLRQMRASAEKSQRESLSRETHYRNILNSLSSFVGVLSPDGRIIYTNDASMRMVSEDRDSVIGQHVPHTAWFKDLPEEKEKMIEALSRAARGEHVRIDTRHRHTNGSIVDLDLAISPMRDETGVITHLVPSAIDITDRKRREEQLRKAELEADVANKAKTLFLANMSHEIRTPLGIMLGFAELLREPNGGPHDRDSYVDSIIRNGRQLTRIIDEILDVSKIEADRMELDRVDFSLREFASDIQSFVEFQCREKGLTFEFSLKAPQGLNMVVSDPGRLRQIVLNMTSNAVKFTDKGSITVHMSAELETASTRRAVLKVDVIDSGPGVPPDQVDKLFLPFSQADNSMTRKFGGTGLGLYVSRKLARALDGDVILQPKSADRNGANFTLTAPLRVSTVTAPEIPENDEAAADPLPLKDLHVLIIEDSIDNQHLISRYLTRAGATVECASNGQDGYLLALKDSFDVTLMDLQMPVMDGYEAIQKLRDRGYSQPVIALTAHAFPAERQRCFELGFDEHLVKPIDQQALIETLKTFARRARANGDTMTAL